MIFFKEKDKRTKQITNGPSNGSSCGGEQKKKQVQLPLHVSNFFLIWITLDFRDLKKSNNLFKEIKRQDQDKNMTRKPIRCRNDCRSAFLQGENFQDLFLSTAVL